MIEKLFCFELFVSDNFSMIIKVIKHEISVHIKHQDALVQKIVMIHRKIILYCVLCLWQFLNDKKSQQIWPICTYIKHQNAWVQKIVMIHRKTILYCIVCLRQLFTENKRYQTWHICTYIKHQDTWVQQTQAICCT